MEECLISAPTRLQRTPLVIDGRRACAVFFQNGVRGKRGTAKERGVGG
jgi:hypothetical protein